MYNQRSRKEFLAYPLLSRLEATSVHILGGPQIHTLEKSLEEDSAMTRLVKQSRVNSILLSEFLRACSFLLTRSTTLNLEGWWLRKSSCWQVMGWMSCGSLMANSSTKQYLLKGSDFRSGFACRISVLWSLVCCIKSDLKRRSMMSQKGKSPVPPATMTILPGLVASSSRPNPLGGLSWNRALFRSILWILAVNLPFSYTLSMMGRQPVFSSSIIWAYLLLRISLSSMKLGFLLRQVLPQLMVNLRVGMSSFMRQMLWLLRKLTAVYSLVMLSPIVTEQYCPNCRTSLQPRNSSSSLTPPRPNTQIWLCFDTQFMNCTPTAAGASLKPEKVGGMATLRMGFRRRTSAPVEWEQGRTSGTSSAEYMPQRKRSTSLPRILLMTFWPPGWWMISLLASQTYPLQMTQGSFQS